jgi:hypothetical protein
VAAPIPALAPVTTAIRFSKAPAMRLSLSWPLARSPPALERSTGCEYSPFFTPL